MLVRMEVIDQYLEVEDFVIQLQILLDLSVAARVVSGNLQLPHPCCEFFKKLHVSKHCSLNGGMASGFCGINAKLEEWLQSNMGMRTPNAKLDGVGSIVALMRILQLVWASKLDDMSII